MKLIKFFRIVIFSFLLTLLFGSCSGIRKVAETLTNLQRLQFKLENVNSFKLAGVSFANKSRISDFSVSDGLNLTKAFTSKSLPTDFILNVSARNPNDGKGGTTQTTATLTNLDWTLYIDDVPTISGGIDKEIEIPGTGQSSIIPLRVSLDLFKFFQNRGYEGILNLALALGGMNSSPSKLKLDAKPTVSTPIGPITYPGRITIIDKQYN